MLSKGFKIISPKTFEIDVDTVKSKIGNAIVKVDYIAVCKADLRYYLGKRDERILGLKYPMRLIHEATGTILKDNTGKFKVGDKVVLVPMAFHVSVLAIQVRIWLSWIMKSIVKNMYF